MRPKDTWTIVATFFVGVATGIYFYFAGFTQFDVPAVLESAPSFVMEAREYGACAPDACVAWRVDSTGTYRYVPARVGNQIPPPQSGEIERAIVRAVADTLTPTILSQLQRRSADSVCQPTGQDLAVMYTVLLDAKEYHFDSCAVHQDDNQQLRQVSDTVKTLSLTIEAAALES